MIAPLCTETCLSIVSQALSFCIFPLYAQDSWSVDSFYDDSPLVVAFMQDRAEAVRANTLYDALPASRDISQLHRPLPTVFPDVLDMSVRSTQPVGVYTLCCVLVTSLLVLAMLA